MTSVVRLKGHKADVVSVHCFGPNFLASSSDDLSVRIWDMRCNTSCRRLTDEEFLDGELMGNVCVCSRTQHYVFVGYESKIKVFDLRRPSILLGSATCCIKPSKTAAHVKCYNRNGLKKKDACILETYKEQKIVKAEQGKVNGKSTTTEVGQPKGEGAKLFGRVESFGVSDGCISRNAAKELSGLDVELPLPLSSSDSAADHCCINKFSLDTTSCFIAAPTDDGEVFVLDIASVTHHAKSVADAGSGLSNMCAGDENTAGYFKHGSGPTNFAQFIEPYKGLRILSGGFDCSLSLWDTNVECHNTLNYAEVVARTGTDHTADDTRIFNPAFVFDAIPIPLSVFGTDRPMNNPDGVAVAAAGGDGSVAIFELASPSANRKLRRAKGGRKTHEILTPPIFIDKQHSFQVSSLACTSSCLASGGSDQRLCIWRENDSTMGLSGSLVLEGKVNSLDGEPFQNKIVVGTTSPLVEVVDVGCGL